MSNYMEITMFGIASLNFGPLTTSRVGIAIASLCYRYNNRIAKLIPSRPSGDEMEKYGNFVWLCERIQHSTQKKQMEQMEREMNTQF